MEKNDAQISHVAVVKKASSHWKKIFQKKKNPSCLYVQITPTKQCEEIFSKKMGLKIFNFPWFFGSEKLFFTIKLLIKLDQQKIKKTLHTVLETIISQIIL